MINEPDQPSPIDAPTNAASTIPAVNSNPPKLILDDGIVRRFFWATLAWLLIVTGIGVYAAVLKIAPEIVTDARFAFGRINPVHSAMAVYGLLANAVFALVYHSTQRLCGRRMYSWGLSRLHFWSWQMVTLLSSLGPLGGLDSSRLSAESQWPLDAALAVSWIGFFGVNMTLTITRRKTSVAYVSLWFYGASLIVLAFSQLLAIVCHPLAPWTAWPHAVGIASAAATWFQADQVRSFLVIGPLLGAMYYYIPKMVGRPLANYPLAILHFWTLTFLTLWAWPRQIHYSVLPEWVISIGSLAGVALLMPSLAGVVVGWRTIRSDGGASRRDPAVRFVAASLIFYAAWIVLSTLTSLPRFNAAVQYTEWVSAMTHLWSVGFASLLLIGLLYYLAQQIFQTELASRRLATSHFYLAVLSVGLFLVPSFIAAMTQSNYLMSLDGETGNLQHAEFQGVLGRSVPTWFFAAIGGAAFGFGVLLMVINFLRTWGRCPNVYADSVATASPAVSIASPARVDRLDGVPVLEVARRFEQWGQLDWHQRCEQLPRRIFVPIAAATMAAAAVLLLPCWFLSRQDVDLMANADYTPLQLLGRDIYRREGCVSCHSQTVRPLVAETKRYGAPSARLDFANDQPTLWGRRRIGPDLAREGGTRTSLWHWQHLRDPRAVNQRSVMPSFEHLVDRPIDFDDLQSPLDAGSPPAADAAREAEEIAADIVSQGGPLSTGGVLTLNSTPRLP